MRNPIEGSNPTETLTIGLPAETLEAIAQRAAELALERLGPVVSSSPYMTIPEAAEYARCKRQRIDDLLSRRLSPCRRSVGRAPAYLTASIALTGGPSIDHR